MSRTSTRILVPTIAAFALVALTGCAADRSDAAPAASRQAAGGVPVVPAEVGHVHGMAINPADGLLYLGTHGGTMVVDGGAVTRVGSGTIDLMGFTVAGPDHFYASGHPGPGDDLPDPVGLIESTDGAKTWQPLSLTGQADFHTLAASGDQVYAFNGRLLTTPDGQQWTPGDDEVAPASLAADPGRPQTVIATTEHGPALSQDAGATFTHVDGAPLLVFVAWPASEKLWGVGVDGSVHLSTDGGTTWTKRGTPGPATAFTASADGTVVVATGGEIVASQDGGQSFQRVAELADGQ